MKVLYESTVQNWFQNGDEPQLKKLDTIFFPPTLSSCGSPSVPPSPRTVDWEDDSMMRIIQSYPPIIVF